MQKSDTSSYSFNFECNYMMLHQILFFLQLFIAFSNADHQTYPGTVTRPILSDSEASRFTKQAYLKGWDPSPILTSRADYVVGRGGYPNIQSALNAAMKAGGSTRKYIKIQPGTYRELVLIPATNVPITLYGTPGNPSAVHIILSVGANLSGADYAKVVNPNGAFYKNGDPAWSMYNGCATRATIGTPCTSVFWAENNDLQVAHLTIENPSLNGQAVAARSNGDKQHFENVNFYGFQDTLYVDGERAYFNQVEIKGDVDFIFGSALAVIEAAQIIARGDRPRTSAIVFAPNTDRNQKYGFLLVNSKISAESPIASNKGLRLARAWASSSNPNANGQLVIRETAIDNVLNVDAPYDTATNGRNFAGNVAKDRNLDDPKFNRFYEYKNTGAGS